jgi:hypothetical protein
MLELEIQKLTAAIIALTEELRSAKVGNELPTEKETPTNLDKLQQDDRSYREDDAAREKMQAKRKAKVTKEEAEALVEAAVTTELVSVAEALAPVAHLIPESRPDVTETSLKTMALEIVRADSSARALILAILAEHGAKTVTQLDHKHHHEVHARFLSLAHDIVTGGAPF